MSEKKSKLPKGVTQAQVDSWKRAFNNVTIFNGTDKDDKQYGCVLKGADRKIVSAANSIEDSVKRNEMLLNTLWLGGDEEIKKRDDLFLGVSFFLDEVLEIAKFEVKKA